MNIIMPQVSHTLWSNLCMALALAKIPIVTAEQRSLIGCFYIVRTVSVTFACMFAQPSVPGVMVRCNSLIITW